MLYPQIMQPTHAKWSSTDQPDTTDPSHFPTPSDLITRNFMITDTILVSAPSGVPPGVIPGPASTSPSTTTIYGPSSCTHTLSSIASDIRDELPPECRVAFDTALAAEQSWRDTFSSEAEGTLRADLRIGYARFPVNL